MSPLLSRPSVVAVFLVGSGFCSLIYQNVWFRHLRLLFGSSTSANAAVLGIFMAGLGVGGVLLGRKVDRHPNPLWLYGALEVAVAVLSALTPAILYAAKAVYLGLGGVSALGGPGAAVVRMVLAAAVLLGPTVAMGGTLPAAVRAAQRPDSTHTFLALLYGVNTLGAVLGCVGSTFFFFEWLGFNGTLHSASLLNLLLGATAMALANRWPQPGAPPVTGAGVDAPTPLPAAPAAADATTVITLGLAAVSGAVFFVMELVWYRMLGPILGGTSYTFGLVLAVALLGVAAGGMLHALLVHRLTPQLRGLAATCAVQALLTVLPLASGDTLAVMAVGLHQWSALGLAGQAAGWLVVCCVVVMPAAVVAGFQFPYLVAVLKRHEQLATNVGLAYGFNTAGALAGALLAGFWLVPALGAVTLWRAMGLVLLVCGVAGAAVVWRRGERVPLLSLATAAAAFVVAVWSPGPSALWRHSGIGAGRSALAGVTDAVRTRDHQHRYQRALQHEYEGTESSVALLAEQDVSLVVNGKADGSARGDAPTQVSLGMVGALLLDQPRTALVIGLATGSSAGWLGVIPGMERVDVAELEPAMADVATVLGPVNQNVLQQPNVHLLLGDARELMLTSRNRYDIIASEPSNPYRAGVSSLFTREFFEAARDHLTENGVFVQWVQAYEIDWETLGGLLATLQGVLPEVEIWQSHGSDLLVVASMKPLPYRLETLRTRIQQEPFAGALNRAWAVTDVEGVLAQHVGNARFSRAVAQAYAHDISTDDDPRVEFGFARSVGADAPASAIELVRRAMALGLDRPTQIQDGVVWDTVLERRMAFYATLGVVPHPLGTPSPSVQNRMAALAAFVKNQAAQTVQAWSQQEQRSATIVEMQALGWGLAETGDARAQNVLARLAGPRPVEANALLGLLRLRQGDTAAARELWVSALTAFQRDPWPSSVVMKRVLEALPALAQQDPAAAAALLPLLSQPFCLDLLREPRLSAWVSLAVQQQSTPGVVAAVGAFEPHVPWNQQFLQLRAQAYANAGHPLALQAQADLERFQAQGSLPLRLEPVPGAPGSAAPTASP